MAVVLVTGGAGFIGAHFCNLLMSSWRDDVSNSNHLIVLDLMTYAANPDYLAAIAKRKDFTLVEGNICDEVLLRRVFDEYQIETVVNFAAESHVDRSIDDADEFVHTNFVGTYTLLKVCRHYWTLGNGTFNAGCRFHQVSTDEVYGALLSDEQPFTENHAFLPNSPYSASKAAADHMVRAFFQTWGLPVTTSHCSNNFGPFQYKEKLIPLTIERLLNNKPVPVYGDGLQVRDWLFVADHVAGINLILAKGQIGEHYNIGGDGELTNLELIHRLCLMLESKFARQPELREHFPNAEAIVSGQAAKLITHVADRPGHDRRYAIDHSKLQALGYRPEADFDQTLSDTVDWYLDYFRDN